MPDTNSGALDPRVRRVISAVFGIPESAVTLQSSNKTISNWDSLNIISLMMAIESEFGITLTVDEAIDLLSVQKVQTLLHSKGIL